MALELTRLGTFWQWSGDLYYLHAADGREARVYVDSIGETWVDIRRVPEGGYFHSERVDAWRALNGAAAAEAVLRADGFNGVKRIARYAHRVVERGI